MSGLRLHCRPVLLACLLAGSASAQLVQEVRVQDRAGKPVDPEPVVAFTTVKPGAELERPALTRDIRNLRQSGRYAYAAVDVERVPGGVAVIYTVAGKPRISRLVVDGATELGNRKVRELLELGVGDPVDDASLGDRAAKVREAYLKKFFPFAQLTWDIREDAAAGTAEVDVKVDEGKRAQVRHIHFVGNSGVPAADLRKAMKQKRWLWYWSWLTGRGTYKPDDLETDREALRRVYLDRGYLDVQVGEPVLAPRGRTGVDVTLSVAEGPLYRLGEIRTEGVTKFKVEDLQKSLTNQPGEVVSLTAVQGGQAALEDYYSNRGYLGSRVAYDLVPRGSSTVADLVYRVREGEVAHIRDIHLRGNTRTKDEVIRRELTVYPGELYNGGKVRNSERRLRNLGFFDFANAVPEETGDPGLYDLSFEVEEGRTGNLMFGVGYSSVDDLIGFVELSQGNFDLFSWPPVGDGQKLKLRGTVGTERQDIELSFVEPWFLDRKLSLGVDLYQRDRRFLSDEYDQVNTGGSVTLGKPLSGFDRLNLTLGIERIEVTDVDEDASALIKEEEGVQDKHYVGLELLHDSRNNAFVASRGNRTSLSGTISGGPLSGDVEVYALEANTSHYVPLWWDHVLNLRGWASVVETWGDGERVPIFDRLFLGGARTLRGFDYREVGPKDETGEPVGGLSGWMATAEYIVPLAEKFRVAAFYDIGMVYDEAYEFDSSDYNSDVGVGIRFDIPGFPLRLDYAWPLEADEFNDRSSGRFQFTIGYSY